VKRQLSRRKTDTSKSRKKPGRESSLRALRKNKSFGHLDFESLASRTIRISVG
jgi:hypothetical protein